MSTECSKIKILLLELLAVEP